MIDLRVMEYRGRFVLTSTDRLSTVVRRGEEFIRKTFDIYAEAMKEAASWEKPRGARRVLRKIGGLV